MALGAVVAALSACAGPGTPPAGNTADTSSSDRGALALIVGAHANAAGPTPVPAVSAILNEAAAEQWDAAVLVDGGTPKVVAQGPLRSTAKNKYALAREVSTNAGKLAGAVTSAAADTPEVNLLGALDLAGRSVAGNPGPKTVVVIDSGLQTVAPLRFQEPGMLGADPKEITTFLARTKALPDLRGVRLIFSGLGDTAAPAATAGHRRPVEPRRDLASDRCTGGRSRRRRERAACVPTARRAS